jgi:hypothetical protein
MEAVVEKLEISHSIASLRCRERTFQHLKYNRLQNLITYRELRHQVSKQKKTFSIRQLVEAHGEEIFKLIPCWLASPETVSAIFPMEQYFDLVIFDESSQCYVERGLPAMLRARQVVVAGDSQQLQPFDLYQVHIDAEEEGLDVETESLLDLASAYFPKFWLQGHYRSSQLSLIHFSNLHFYDNKLGMVPEMSLLNSGENAFQYQYVDGIWDQQTNYQEAIQAVETVREIIQKHPEYKVGVITFNFFQMELISQLLQENELLLSGKVAVKNIENVQGDEFDWVVFSVGYAKNKKGKLIANFGLLSKKGGSNRLNVAITRARKKITMITSLRTADFNKEQISNPGIHLLYQYLEFVATMASGKPLTVEAGLSRGYDNNWSLHRFLGGADPHVLVEPYPNSPVLDLLARVDGEISEAILTDDQRIYQAIGPKEPFVYHPLLLRSKGWPYRFYFSRQFWKETSLNGSI